MTGFQCEQARAVIPEVAAERATPADRRRCAEHVDACEACAAELELAKLLFTSRATAPEGLAERVASGVAVRRTRTPAPWWAASAAAVAALALGIGMNAEPGPVAAEAPGFAIESEEGALWSADDGLIAGAPTLDGLSEEALAQLLDELTVGEQGGTT